MSIGGAVVLFYEASKVLGTVKLAKWRSTAYGVPTMEATKIGTIVGRVRRNCGNGKFTAAPQYPEGAVLCLGKMELTLIHVSKCGTIPY